MKLKPSSLAFAVAVTPSRCTTKTLVCSSRVTTAEVGTDSVRVVPAWVFVRCASLTAFAHGPSASKRPGSPTFMPP